VVVTVADMLLKDSQISSILRIRGIFRLLRVFMLLRRFDVLRKKNDARKKTSTGLLNFASPVERVLEILGEVRELCEDPTVYRDVKHLARTGPLRREAQGKRKYRSRRKWQH